MYKSLFMPPLGSAIIPSIAITPPPASQASSFQLNTTGLNTTGLVTTTKLIEPQKSTAFTMQPSQHQPALQKGDVVVLTGVNGNIASHIADQLIKAGFVVRGTVRDKTKNTWLADCFDRKYGRGHFELVEIPDVSASGALDEAVRGASGFIHTAMPVMRDTDPNVSVPVVIRGTINALEAAAREPRMKRFVLTSSSGASTAPKPDRVFHIDKDLWNNEAVEAAWAPPPYEGFERMLNVYYAGKTESERAAWKWVEEHAPGFTFNCVLPNANFGPVLDPVHQQYHSTLGWVRAVWDGFEGHQDTKSQPPQYYVNIVDDALVHVAALMYEDVKGERLFAFAHPYNWNDILGALRKLYPTRQFIDDVPGLGRDLSTVSNERAEELLRRITGHGWTNLEDTIAASVKDYN